MARCLGGAAGAGRGGGRAERRRAADVRRSTPVERRVVADAETSPNRAPAQVIWTQSAAIS
jgi:hypothetical protein